jgi:hypothetical protein
MEAQPWKVQILRRLGCVQPGKNESNPVSVLCLDACLLAGGKKGCESFVAEVLYHCNKV